MNDLFSERYQYVAKKLQYEYLNEFSKAHLWDEINWYFLVKAKKMHEEDNDEYEKDNECSNHAFNFYYHLCRDFLGKSADDFEIDPPQIRLAIKNIVMNTKWHNVFDVVEAFVRLSPKLVPDNKKRKIFLKTFQLAINKVLEEERCSYRVVSGMILPKVNDTEVITIANALVDTNSIHAVNTHLEQAIKHYSNRHNPDYRNAIKESISALESLLKIIAGTKSATLDGALKTIVRKNNLVIHEKLQESIIALYAWTNAEGGLRHGLKGESKINIDDAKLMIATCCSYISYLTAKSIESGINIDAQT